MSVQRTSHDLAAQTTTHVAAVAQPQPLVSQVAQEALASMAAQASSASTVPMPKVLQPLKVDQLQEARIGETKALIQAEREVPNPREFLLSAEAQAVPEFQEISNWLKGLDALNEESLQAALRRAAMAMPSDVVRFLLSARSAISEEELAEIVLQAASFGRISSVRYLLSEGRALSREKLCLAALSAIKSGQSDMVRFLVSEYGEYSQKHIDKLFEAASGGSMLKQGFPEILTALFSMGKKPSQNCLGVAVVTAVRNHSLEIVRVLLSEGRTLEPRQVLDAASKALMCDDPELLGLILSDGRTLAVHEIGRLFCQAVQFNTMHSAQFFITNGRTVDPDDLISAMRIAVERNRHEIIRIILDLRLVPHQEMLGSVVEVAVGHGHLPIARCLLAQIQGHFKDRGDVLILAARLNSRDLVEDLLRRGPIVESVRDYCLSMTSCPMIRDVLHTAATISRESEIALMGMQFERYVDPQRLKLSLTKLKTHPEGWLQHLAGRGLPKRVCFTEFSRAVDLGGVMKQFIATLCEGLIEKNIFSRQSSGLMTCESDEEAIRLRQLGKFFSDIDQRNHSRSDRFLTGRMCHPRFFEFAVIACQIISREEILQQGARLLSACDPEKELVAQVVLNPTLENCQQLQTLIECEAGQEVAYAKSIVGSYLRAAFEIYAGAREQFQSQMLEDPVGTLLAIQGEEASAESILHALVLQTAEARANTYFCWIREEIAAADQDFRKKFLKAITGKTSLSPGDRIDVMETLLDGGVFEIHTCYNSLALPKIDLDQEQFIEALKSCLDDHYNIA